MSEKPRSSVRNRTVSVHVTLVFPTIGAAVAALREIPEASLLVAPAVDQVPAVAPVVDQKPAAAKAPGKPAPSPVAAAPGPSAAASAQTSPAASPAAPEVEYEALRKATVALAARNRDVAAAVVAGFGVKSFKDLASDQWPEALARVNAEMARLEGGPA